MLKYILKRILIFIPTLVAISLITFAISINAPGDPVEMMLNQQGDGGQASDKMATEKSYNQLRHKLGLDLPIFYFSFTNATQPDTLYKIPKKNHRETLERLSFKYGNWKEIANYYSLIKKFELELYRVSETEDNASYLQKAKDYTNSLYTSHKEEKVTKLISQIEFYIKEDSSILRGVWGHFKALKNSILDVIRHQSPGKRYIPVINWYGVDNQYHRWMFGDKPWFKDVPKSEYQSAGFIRGDFGISYQDKRPVKSVLWDALGWTLLFSSLSIFIAYLIAIPLGVKSAVDRGSKVEKGITTGLFMLYSIPNFWIGTMLIIFLCGGDYLDLFPPAFSLGQLPDSAPFWDRFGNIAYRMILPLFCMTYTSFAFISRQMRGGMLNVIGQDYIRTARAKGLNKRNIVWKHAFRNSLIPIITLFATVFPLAIGGSIVIEILFSIPGMGKITFEAITARNYPIVFTVLMFTSILTLAGILVADILYTVVDPRITFSNKKS